MSADTELTLLDYLGIFKRRLILVATLFLSILGCAAAVALLLPPTYESSGTILVESQQVSEQFVPTSTSYGDERISVIRQRVMTRENLLKIIDKYKLFENATRPLSVSEKTDSMRDQIRVELMNSNSKNRGQSTIAFKVFYDDRSPIVAFRVANDLVTLFLDENVKVRTARATETTEFLTQEADKLKSDLDNIENRIADYKQQHSNALPEHLDLHMSMVQRADAELREAERDLTSAEEEHRFLEFQLSSARSGVSDAQTPADAQSPAQRLVALRAEYERLRAMYTDKHPDVIAVTREIKSLEAAVASGAPDGANAAPGLSNPDVARIQARMSANNARTASLQAQIAQLRQKISSYQADILDTPQVERGLVTLERDHENAQKKYDEIRAKQMNAKIAESLEQENKAERFSLLEPPLMADKPIKPNRKKVALMGFAMALAVSLGAAFLLEQLNPRVRGPRALAGIVGQQPIVSIPYITTLAELQARKRNFRIGIASIVIAIAVGLTLVHYLYMPLDVLFFKIFTRIS